MGASASRVCGSWGKPYPEESEKAKFVTQPIDSEQFLKDTDDPETSKQIDDSTKDGQAAGIDESQSATEGGADEDLSTHASGISTTDSSNSEQTEVKRVKGTRKLPQTSDEWEALQEKDFQSSTSRAKILAHVIKKLQKNDPEMQEIRLFGYEKEKLKPLAKALERNESLKGLTCHNCSIDVETAKEFADMLRINKTLAWLDLSENNLGDAGTRALAIDALERNTSLVTLLLDHNGITHVGAKALADTLLVNNTLRRLSLSRNKIKEGAEHFVSVIKCNNLWQLRLNFNEIPPEIMAKFKDAIKIATNLEDINLHHDSLPVALLRGPPPWPGLKFPKNHKNYDDNPEIEYSEVVTLKHKKYCSADYFIIAALLPYNTLLTDFDLYKSVPGRAGIFALARVLREYPPDFPDQPQTNKKIRQIRVGEGTMWIPLDKFRGERRKDTDEPSDGFLDLRYDAKKKEDLDPSGALFIAALLKYNTHVRSLTLTGNPVHKEGMAFARTLLTNTKLEELDLSNTLLSQESIDAIIYVLRTLSPQSRGAPAVKVHLVHNSNDYRTLRKVEASTGYGERPPRNPIPWYIWPGIFLYPLLLPYWIYTAIVSCLTLNLPESQVVIFGLKNIVPKKLRAPNKKGNLARGYFLRMVTNLDLSPSPLYAFFLLAFGYLIVWWPWVLAFSVLPSSTKESPAIGCMMVNYVILVVTSLLLWWTARGDREQSRIAFPSRRALPRPTLLNALVLLSLFLDLIQFSVLPLINTVYPQNTYMDRWNYMVFVIPFQNWIDASGVFWGAFCVVTLFLLFGGFFHLCAWHDLQLFLHFQPYAEVIMYLFSNVFYFTTIIALIRFTDCTYHDLTHNSTLDIYPGQFCWNEQHSAWAAGALFLLTYYVLGVNFFGSLFFDNLSPSLDLQWSNGQQIFDRSGKLIYALLLIYCKKSNGLEQMGVGLGILVLFILAVAVKRHPPTSPFMRSLKILIYASGLWTCVITLSGTFMVDPQLHNWTLVTVVIGWGYLLIVFILSLFLPTVEGRLFAQNTQSYLKLLKEREKAYQSKLERIASQDSDDARRSSGGNPDNWGRQKSQRFQPPSLPPQSPTLRQSSKQSLQPDHNEVIIEVQNLQPNGNKSEISSDGESDEQRPTFIHQTSGSNLDGSNGNHHKSNSKRQLQTQYNDDDEENGNRNNNHDHFNTGQSEQDEENSEIEYNPKDRKQPQPQPHQQNGSSHSNYRQVNRELDIELASVDSASKHQPPPGSRSPTRSAFSLKNEGRKGTFKTVSFQNDS